MVTEYLGAVKIFAGNYAPIGYALAQGQLMSIQQNTALFALLGTNFGGNGISNFQLPDLRSRLPIGQGNGSGLKPRIIGENGGFETVTLTTNTIPPHNHVFNAGGAATTTNIAGSTVLLGQLQTADGTFYAPAAAPGLTTEPLNAAAVAPVGGGGPHNNIQPAMGLNYIIALFGVFPSRS